MSNTKIASIHAREVIDSRGNPTVEAEVTLHATEAVYPVLKDYENQLRYLFIVSSVKLERATAGNGATAAGVSVEVGKAPGQKCGRCWNYSTHVGENPRYPMVCERCSSILAEIEAEQEKPA